MKRLTLTQWIEHGTRHAQPVIDNLDLDALLAAQRGKPFSIMTPLLLGHRHEQESVPDTVQKSAARYPDLALWWSLVDPEFNPSLSIDTTAAGPLFDQDAFTAIEVWTETELSALHALSHNPKMSRRINDAVDWHLECTQPDNATNRPWALHVFAQHATPEADHFAQTLVSNCLVQNAAPDPLSALILLDAIGMLRKFAGLAPSPSGLP